MRAYKSNNIQTKIYIHKNENGIVAIFSVLIIMGILGLLALGFSSIIRQAQRRTLDDHLSNQAFYAAESGINMAINKINSGGAPLSKKDDCPQGADYDYSIDPSNNIMVSCLLVNPTVKSIENSLIDSNGTVNSAQLSALSSRIVIGWDSVKRSDTIPSTAPNQLPDKDVWNTASNIGVLKIELIPKTASLDRNTLVNNSYIFYLYPSPPSVSDTVSINNTTDKGRIIQSRCDTSLTDGYRCLSKIDLSGIGVPTDEYYVKQSSLYRDVSTSISFNDSSDAQVDITGSQALIDSTGKANDVFRRIQVRVPIDSLNTGGTIFNTYAIFSGDRICKRYSMSGRTPSDEYKDDCASGPDAGGTVASASTPGPGPGNGSATIGEFPVTGGYDPSSPEFVFDMKFINDTDRKSAKVTGCTWDFGDGSPKVNLPPNQCDQNDLVSYTYPDTRANIDKVRNIYTGCRIYRVVLVMHYAGGVSDGSDTMNAYLPRGRANDKPDPSIGRPAGICYGHYRFYIP